MPKLDILPIGSKMGRLTLVEEVARQGTKRRIHCLCDCGAQTTALWQNLKRGATTSCGCYAKDVNTIHGGSRTRVFQIWSNMMARCYRPNTEAFPYYGGRGIQVCAIWRNFEAFRGWAEENGYNDHLTIERQDIDRHYEPGNCYWADLNTQAANKTKRRGSSTPYIGVSKWGTKWAAHITQHGVRTKVGVFDTPNEAVSARNEYIKRLRLPHRIQLADKEMVDG